MKRLTVIEIGAAHYGVLMPLLDKDWHESSRKNIENRFPAELFSYAADYEWEGYFAEPSPMRFSRLIEMQGHRKNARFIQGGLSSASRFGRMHIGTQEYAACTLEPVSHEKYSGEFILQTFTLDDLLDFLDVTPTLLYLDVEFEEMGVLETYSFSRRPDFWMIDMHHRDHNIQKAIQIFERNGYKILTTTGHPTDKDELWVKRIQS